LDLTFSIVLPAPGQAPFYWIACQHKTPHHYLRSDFTTHDNGALALKNIIAIAKDPAAAAKHYVKNWQASIIEDEDLATGPVIVRRGNVELHIYTPANFYLAFEGIVLRTGEDHIVGFSALVKDIDQIPQRLQTAGFSPLNVGGKITVQPSQACGCLVVFEGDNSGENMQ